MNFVPEGHSVSTPEQIRDEAKKNLFAISRSRLYYLPAFEKYLNSEVDLAKSKTRRASPKFDLKADQDEQHYSNALKFLSTDGKLGRDSMEAVLIQLCDEKNEEMREATKPQEKGIAAERFGIAMNLRETVLNDNATDQSEIDKKAA